MLVDPDGLLLVCVVCAALGFFVGWAGGFVEGRQRGRARGVAASDGLWQVSYDYGESWVDWPRKPDPVRDAGLAMAKVRHLAGVGGTLSDQEKRDA